jgi:flagellar biosynthesis component FlhA
MKSFAFLSLAALVAGAAALPTHDDYKKEEYKKEEYKKNDHKDNYEKEDAKKHSLSFPFEFTSTYHAYATADQM